MEPSLGILTQWRSRCMLVGLWCQATEGMITPRCCITVHSSFLVVLHIALITGVWKKLLTHTRVKMEKPSMVMAALTGEWLAPSQLGIIYSLMCPFLCSCITAFFASMQKCFPFNSPVVLVFIYCIWNTLLWFQSIWLLVAELLTVMHITRIWSAVPKK